MSRHKELTGMKFGKLTVLSLDHKVKTEKARFRRGDKNDRLIRPVAKGAYRCN